jgi:hypothetical protein
MNFQERENNESSAIAESYIIYIIPCVRNKKLRVLSSGRCCSVVPQKFADVSGEHPVSIFRVEE